MSTSSLKSVWLRTFAIPTATRTTAQGSEEGPQEPRRDPSVRSAAAHAEVQQRLLPALRRACGHRQPRAQNRQSRAVLTSITLFISISVPKFAKSPSQESGKAAPEAQPSRAHKAA